MRILILSHYYAPEPVPKPSELACALAESGHDVSVLTGFPNYPAGKLYEGYRLRISERTTVGGIPVLRTWIYPYHGKSVIRRLLNYGSAVVSMAIAIPRLRKADVMYVWHPPLTIGIAAWLVSRARRIPFVYDVQDIWPESAVLSGLLKPGRAVRVMSVIERFVYKRASHILVVTEGAKDNLVGKGVPPTKVSVMPHWIDEELFGSSDPAEVTRIREEHGWAGRFVVLFAGNLGLVQGLDTVVRAAVTLDPSRIRIVFVGDGSDRARLERLANDLGVTDRVQFVGYRPLTMMPAYMAASDLLLVHLKRSQLSRYVVPTKTYAYLAAGKPILMAMEGAAADLVASAQAGVIIPPDEPDSLAEAISRVQRTSPIERDSMGANGRSYLRTKLSKQTVLRQYERLLEAVATAEVF